MFTSGFSLPKGDDARESSLKGLEFLRDSSTTHGVTTVGSLPELGSDGHLYNTAYVCRPDGAIESYRKIHLFSYGEETAHYAPGDRTLTVQIGDLRCSLFICYDLRFPIPFHQLAPSTDLFIVVANWPTPRREHWLTLLRARAIENQAYVAGVNRVGEGGGLSYSGDSILFAPDGSPLNDVEPREKVLIHEVSASEVSAWRNTFPSVKDRRSDIYQKVLNG
jgi:predicted amidohydrolase